MKLDCEQHPLSGKWSIVDYDDLKKTIATDDSVEGAWYQAAMVLQETINKAIDAHKEIFGYVP